MARTPAVGPMALTGPERELIVEWLTDQRETWANVGDRPMMGAIDVLIGEAREAPDPESGGG